MLMSRFFLLFIITAISCTNPENANDQVNGSNQTSAGNITWENASSELQMFAPDIVSTRYFERDIAISPDGNEIFFTRVSSKRILNVIMQVRKVDGEWQPAEVASFSGRFTDLEPAFSPDGSQLFFVSNRPIDEGTETKDHDIWVATKTGNSWDSLRNIGAPVNTPGNEFYPSVAANGNLYYTARRESSKGGEDIFMSVFENGEYQEPVSLSEGVNSEKDEFNAYVSADESYLVFGSFRRDDGLGGGDLYISFKNDAGEWKPAANLGNGINSRFLDFCPFVSADGQTFFFTSDRSSLKSSYDVALTADEYHALIDSNGNGNIFYVNFSELAKHNQ